MLFVGWGTLRCVVWWFLSGGFYLPLYFSFYLPIPPVTAFRLTPVMRLPLKTVERACGRYFISIALGVPLSVEMIMMVEFSGKKNA